MSFKHRFFDDMVQARKKGINQFIIHGDSIKDELVFNYGLGAQTTQCSLAFNLLLEEKSQIVLMLNQEGLFKCALNSMEFTTELLENHIQVEAALSLTSHNVSIEELMKSKEVNFEQAYRYYLFYSLTSALNSSLVPIYIIVDSLEWMTSWWNNLEFLEEIQKWREIIDGNNMHMSILLLPFIDSALDYLSINSQSHSIIRLDAPSREEIEILLNKMTRFHLSHSDLQGCISILKRNNLLLKEIAYLVANILSEQMPSEDFSLYSSLSKELKHNIEERVFYDDVIVDGAIKKRILTEFESFLSTNQHSVSKGLLMHGEPGTGKTMIAKALANQEGFYFLAPKLADLKGRYLGESAKNVQELFREARKNAPCVIFIDEIDSFLTRRNARNHDAFQSEMLNQFLTEVDGVDSAFERIYILAATNFLDNVDAAVLSRLDSVHIPLPSTQQREEIFLNLLQVNDISLEESLVASFAKKTEGFSGREIKKVVQKMSAGYSIDQILGEYRASQMREMQNEHVGAKMYTSGNKPMFAEIVGLQSVKEIVHSAVTMFQRRELYAAFDENLIQTNTLLIYGESKSTKTTFVNATANEYGLDFVRISGAMMISSLQNGDMEVFEEIFKKVIKLSQIHSVLLYLEDFEKLSALNVDIRIRVLIKEKIWQLQKHNVFLVAATNFGIEHLCGSFVKDGVFNHMCHIKSEFSIDGIFKLLRNFCTADKIDMSRLDLDSLSIYCFEQKYGIDTIEKLCKNAKMRAIDSNNIQGGKAFLEMEYFMSSQPYSS